MTYAFPEHKGQAWRGERVGALPQEKEQAGEGILFLHDQDDCV